jgi:hypothetical protein
MATHPALNTLDYRLRQVATAVANKRYGSSALLSYRKRPAQERRAKRGNQSATDRLSAIIPGDTL